MDHPRFTVQVTSSKVLTPAELLESEDASDDEKDDYILDVHSVRSMRAKKADVELYLPQSMEKIQLRTRGFLWRWPWLKATVESERGINGIKGNSFKTIAYELDDTEGPEAISLFFKSMGRNKGESPTMLIEEFIAFVNEIHVTHPSSVRLSNLQNLADQFEERGRGRQIDGSRQQRTILFSPEFINSKSGSLFHFANSATNFFKIAALLFPRKISSINSERILIHERYDLLKIFENVLLNAPWKFGFAPILFEETKTVKKLSGLEATLHAMKKAPFYNSLDPLHKDALHVYDIIKEACQRDGHTYLLIPNILYWQKHMETKKRHKGYRIGNLDKALQFLLGERVLHKTPGFSNEEFRYHLMRYWNAEESIVRSLGELAERNKVAEREKVFEKLDLNRKEFQRIRKDSDQVEAAMKITQNAITLISGRGGTGKTEVVTTVLEAIEKNLKKTEKGNENSTNVDEYLSEPEEDQKEKENKDLVSNGPILYAAPTGKAAAVIRKRIGKPAVTIHQILASFKAYMNMDPKPETEWKYAKTKILALDETSMISMELFSTLIKNMLLSSENFCKLVLLGDIDQLPSVDPGNLMSDLRESLDSRGFVVNLRKNHRSEGSLIFQNAILISQNEMPIIDPARGFSLICPDPRDKDIETSFREFKYDKDKYPCKPNPHLHAKIHTYTEILENRSEECNVSDPWNSQFIAFTNDECHALNQVATSHYNNHCMYNLTNGKANFVEGDKIMATRNDDVNVLDEEDKPNFREFDCNGNKEKEKVRCCNSFRFLNGTLYKIKGTEEKMVRGKGPNVRGSESDQENLGKYLGEFYNLDDLDKEIVSPEIIPFKMKCKPSHAYALTIHKFQGSEIDHVVYGLSNSNNETSQHVYTAITRAKKSVVIVAGKWDLMNAVKRKPYPRQTTLVNKVKRLCTNIEISRVQTENLARFTPERMMGVCQRRDEQEESPSVKLRKLNFYSPRD